MFKITKNDIYLNIFIHKLYGTSLKSLIFFNILSISDLLEIQINFSKNIEGGKKPWEIKRKLLENLLV